MDRAGETATLEGRWRPGLVALDLDGTVVPVRAVPFVPDAKRPAPSLAVRAAVDAVVAAGVPVVVATGRSLWGSLDTVTALGLTGIHLVCSNGAIGYDLAAEQLTVRAEFHAGPVVRALSEALPGIGFAAEHDIEGFRTTPGFARDFTSQFLDVITETALEELSTSRLVCRADTHSAEAVVEAAARLLPGTGTNWHSQRPGWLDIGPVDVSKATGVAAVAAKLGVPADDVLAIGDDTNDLELFAWAGCAIAMGQASAAIQSKATFVTGTVDADGAATALARWFGVHRGHRTVL